MAKGINSYVRKGVRAEVLSEPCCFWCGVKDSVFQVDHIVPPQLGGLPIRINMKKSCHRCNASKNDKTLTAWRDHCIKRRDEVFLKTTSYLYRLPHNRVKERWDLVGWLIDKIALGRAEHSAWCHRIGKINLILNG